MYQPDPNATPLDRALMAVARQLHDTGSHEDAEAVAGAAAELREFWTTNEPLNDLMDVYVVMERVNGASATIMKAMSGSFVPPFADHEDIVERFRQYRRDNPPPS